MKEINNKKMAVKLMSLNMSDKKRTYCGWTHCCPTKKDKSITCKRCPADNSTKKVSYVEAIKWWEEARRTKKQGE